jgi:hypothetical protein
VRAFDTIVAPQDLIEARIAGKNAKVGWGQLVSERQQSRPPSPDSAVAIFDGQRCLQEIDCERSLCRVAYEFRGSLTFKDAPGNLRFTLIRGGGFFVQHYGGFLRIFRIFGADQAS